VSEGGSGDVLDALRRRLRDEEAAYAEALATLDALAAASEQEESLDETEGLVRELNDLWSPPPPAADRGLRGFLARGPGVAAQAIERQTRFNAVVVRVLNALRGRWEGDRAQARDLAGALIRYAQRVEPMMDARDRMRVATVPSRAEQVLEVFGERLRAMNVRLEGLLALRDRIEALSEEVRALRGTLGATMPAPEAARTAERTADASVYTAFENRFRGSREEIRSRQKDYVALFAGLSPVVDLGCGRGEFLELLGEAGIAARGVEGNAHAARDCRERGLDVVEADLLESLRAEPEASLGGLFAAQVVEHLPPATLVALLRESHRALRPGGLLVLETVNAASALAFLDVFLRDLTHDRPLHPDTLRFLAAAAGFSDVRVELRSPVPADVRLHTLPGSGLPPPVLKALNENVERLNTLLFAPIDYALIARR
jgi:SAM-dependent methyltransferase